MPDNRVPLRCALIAYGPSALLMLGALAALAWGGWGLGGS